VQGVEEGADIDTDSAADTFPCSEDLRWFLISLIMASSLSCMPASGRSSPVRKQSMRAAFVRLQSQHC